MKNNKNNKFHISYSICGTCFDNVEYQSRNKIKSQPGFHNNKRGGFSFWYLFVPFLTLTPALSLAAHITDDFYKCERDSSGRCVFNTVTDNSVVTDNVAIIKNNSNISGGKHNNGPWNTKPTVSNSGLNAAVGGVLFKNDKESDSSFNFSHYTDKFGYTDSKPGLYSTYMYGLHVFADKNDINGYGASDVTFIRLDGSGSKNTHALIDIDALSLNVDIKKDMLNTASDLDHSSFSSTILDADSMNIDIGFKNHNNVEIYDPIDEVTISKTMFLRSEAYNFLSDKCREGSNCQIDMPANHTSENYTIKARNSTVNFISRAHLYSDIVYKIDEYGNKVRDLDKYGVSLDNSHITFRNDGDYKILHSSNIINKGGSSVTLNFGVYKEHKVKSDMLDMQVSYAEKIADGHLGSDGGDKNFSYGYNQYGTIHNSNPSQKLEVKVNDNILNNFKNGNHEAAMHTVKENFDKIDENKYESSLATLLQNVLKLDGKGISDLVNFGQSGNEKKQETVTQIDTADKRYIYTQVYENKESLHHAYDKDNNFLGFQTLGSLSYKVIVEESQQGRDGVRGQVGKPVGTMSNYVTLGHNLNDIGTRELVVDQKAHGTDGAHGTDAHIFGNGGDGGRGGNGAGYFVQVLQDSPSLEITGKADVTIIGAHGGNGGNGGMHHNADGHKNNGSIKDGKAGEGGNGGLAFLRGYKVVGNVSTLLRDASSDENYVKLKDASLQLTSVAGKGGISGNIGDLTNVDKNGKSGLAQVYGLDIRSGATMLIQGDNVIDVKAVVHDRQAFDNKSTKAYSIYSIGASSPFVLHSRPSTIEVDGNINLTTSIENTATNDKKTGNGMFIANSLIVFKDGSGQKSLLDGNSKYNTLTTDYVEYMGDNGIVFYTDLTDIDNNGHTGDTIVVTKGMQIADGARLKIRIESDQAVRDIKNIPDKYYVASEGLYRLTAGENGPHVLIDLPDDPASKLSDKQLANINSRWELDSGAIKLDLGAEIMQDEKYDIVLNSLTAHKSERPSNSVEAAIDNAFLINRMAFTLKSQLSERFRVMKKDGSHSNGLWVEYINTDIGFNIRPEYKLKTSSKLRGTVLGADSVFSFGVHDVMLGAYAGYAKMDSNVNKFTADSKTTDKFAGIYGAFDCDRADVYVEGGLSYHWFSSTVSAHVDDAAHGTDTADLELHAFGIMAAIGKRFDLPFDIVSDVNVKFDSMLFMGDDYTSRRGLTVYNDTYHGYGLSGSLLLGQYYNDRNTFIYVKGEYGEYFNDVQDRVSIGDSGKIYTFKTPDYDFRYANIIAGITQRFFDRLDLNFEFNRFYMSGSEDNDYGIKGEIRYIF